MPVFCPLSDEQIAAKKHSTAANMKAMVRADMKGVATALGKKVDPSKIALEAVGKPVASGPIACSKVPMGL